MLKQKDNVQCHSVKLKKSQNDMKENAKNIIQKKINEVVPYKRNPRKNDNAVDYVANSIREFGFQSPIIIDENDVIICGHTRYKAAKKLGLKTVPCIVAKGLTDEQVKAYRITDNKVSEMSEWDDALLKGELSELSGIDMSEFGIEFSDPVEKAYLKEIAAKSPPKDVIIVMSFPVEQIKDAQKVIEFAGSLTPSMLEHTFVYEKTSEN